MRCSDCGEECKAVEETFDYAGTHCTFGRSGTHHTGFYVSSCCSADLNDSDVCHDYQATGDQCSFCKHCGEHERDHV